MDIAGWNPDLAQLTKNLFFGPGFFLILLFALPFWGLRLARRPQPVRRALRAGGLSMLLLLIYCTPYFSRALRAPLVALSDRATAPDCLSRSQAIVVLGGGIFNDQLPTTASLNRILRAAEALNDAPKGARPAVVVLSGGITKLREKGDVPEAGVYAPFLRSFLKAETLATTRVLLEEESQNTYQNVAYTRRLLEQNAIPLKVAVVTSSLHMPRSLAVFRHAGFEACAVPATDRNAYPPTLLSFGNATSALEALNEWFGFVGYKLKGWI